MNATPDDPAVALARWRADHPEATLAEIEQAVDAHLSAYRTSLIMDAAMDAPPPTQPTCLDCATPMQKVGRRSRTVRTAHDGTLTFTEFGWRCPACNAGLFPPQ